jgi:hypothetical protein
MSRPTPLRKEAIAAAKVLATVPGVEVDELRRLPGEQASGSADRAGVGRALQNLLQHVAAPERGWRPPVAASSGDRLDAAPIQPGLEGADGEATRRVPVENQPDRWRRFGINTDGAV